MKPFECIENIRYIIGGDEIVLMSQYFNIDCTGTTDNIVKFQNGEFDNSYQIMFKHNYKNLYKYIVRNDSDGVWKRYFEKDRCYENYKLYAYKDYMIIISIEYQDDKCTIFHQYSEYSMSPYMYGSDYLEYSKDLCYLYFYNDMEECKEYKNSPPRYDIFKCEDDYCMGKVVHFHNISFNETHYNVSLTRYQVGESDEECSTIKLANEDFSQPFDSCAVFGDTFKLGKNKLSRFGKVICEGGSCTSNSFINLTEPILVDYNLIISNSSTVYIPIGDGDENSLIIVEDNGYVDIEGGIVIIPIETDDELNYLIENIENNSTYKYTIIKGRYKGSFDDIIIELSPDLKENNRCETVEPSFQNDSDELSIVFSLNKSNCSNALKWWIILLICLGIIVVLTIILIALILMNKKIRKKVLPFRRT